MIKVKIEYQIFLLYCLLSFLFFWKPIITGQAFFGEDFLWQFLPMNHVALELIHSGQWPLWNPYMMSGMPLFASLSFPLFYPGVLLFLFLSQHQATMILYWIHIALAGYFTYRFFLLLQDNQESNPSSHLPAILAGISFMFAGNLITLIYPGHTMKLIAASFIPMVMYCLGKGFKRNKLGWFLMTGVVLSLQIFTTHFQVCYYTWILVGLYSIAKLIQMTLTRDSSLDKTFAQNDGKRANFRKVLIYLSLTGLVIVGLTAVQWLPFWEYTQWCTRSGGLDYKAATEASFPPEELLSLMMVSPFGDQIHPFGNKEDHFAFVMQESSIGKILFPAGSENYFGRFNSARTLSEYLGVIPFFLATIGIVLSRRKLTKFFIGVAALSAILSLGKFNPIYPFLLKVIPGLNMFRVPAEILLLFTFSLSILAGIGLYELLNQNLLSQRMWRRLVFDIVILFVGFIIIDVVLRSRGVIQESGIDHFVIVIVRWVVISLICLILLKLLIDKKVLWVPYALCGLVIVDLWSAHQPYLQTMKIEPYYQFVKGDPGVLLMKQDKGVYRFLPLGSSDMVNNKWLFSDIQSVWGYQSFPLKHYAEFWSRLGFSNPTLRKLMNVKYISSPETIDDPQLQLVYDGNKKIYQDTGYIPRAWTVDQENLVLNILEEKNWEILQDPQFDPKKKILMQSAIISKEISVEKTLPKQVQDTTSSPSIIDYSWSPQKIDINVSVPRHCFLVLSEIYYPGWKAYVDDKPSKIYRADFILRAIHVTAGSHWIKMVYSPESFWIGLWMSGITLICIIVYFVLSFIRKRKKKDV